MRKIINHLSILSSIINYYLSANCLMTYIAIDLKNWYTCILNTLIILRFIMRCHRISNQAICTIRSCFLFYTLISIKLRSAQFIQNSLALDWIRGTIAQFSKHTLFRVLIFKYVTRFLSKSLYSSRVRSTRLCLDVLITSRILKNWFLRFYGHMLIVFIIEKMSWINVFWTMRWHQIFDEPLAIHITSSMSSCLLRCQSWYLG